MAEPVPRESRELLARARDLRQHQTEAEAVLWEQLRRKKVCGWRFRRQHPIGRYIADFFCDDARLIIEVDGLVHDEVEQRQRDLSREVILREHGFACLRFSNDDVLHDTGRVVQDIAAYVKAHAHGHPLPRSAGEGAGGGGR